MKVPSLTSPRTNPAMQGLASIRPVSNPMEGANAVARGLGQLGNSVSQFEATLQQRDEATNRFDYLRKLSEMQSEAGARITELKRSYNPDGKGFVEAANNTFKDLETQYLEQISPALQQEFKYRTQGIRQGLLSDAMNFQYTAGDAWFKQGVSDELNKAKILLDQAPGQLEAQQSHIVEIINATDLPQAQKIELQRQASISLAAVTYKAEIRKDPSLGTNVGVGPISDAESGAANILRKEEGFRDTPYWDVNAYRTGYGSDTVTKENGDVVKVTQGMVITKADAERDLERRVKEFQNTAIKQVGPEAWQNLPAGAKAGLISVAYNYGSLPGGVAAAARSGDIQAIAGAVAGLSANPDRRQREAAIIRGEAGLSTDPRFEVIPYEDRLALRDDAMRESRAAAVAQAAQAKAQRDEEQNSLYLGLLDGTKGQMDIDNARTTGTLDDYESVNKALNILKTRTAELNVTQGAYEKLASGGAWDPTSSEDKGMLNALVKQGNGLDRINQGDENYITQTVVPLVAQTGDVPTSVAGALMGMIRGADNNRMMYALDALAQLRDTNPIAFNQRVTEDVAKQVDLWDARKDLVPKDELASLVRGATNQADRQNQDMLRTEAKNLLGQASGGVSKLKENVDKVISSFGGYTWSAEVLPFAQQALSREFQTLFIDQYAKTGNEEVAADLASKALTRNWGVTSIGSGSGLMKYPPEKTGYRKINGSYDWINKSVQEDLKLNPEESFELMSDEQTQKEFSRFQQDPNAPPPSYRVFIKDANSVYRERLDETGQPVRLNFKPDSTVLEDEAKAYDLKEEVFRLNEIISNYARLQLGAVESGQQVPPEETALYQEAASRLQELGGTPDKQNGPSAMEIFNSVNAPKGLY